MFCLVGSQQHRSLCIHPPFPSRPSPAGHEDCLMGSKLLTAHHYDNISQDVTAPKAIKVEKNITGMAGELDTAVSRRGHLVFTC